MMAAFHVLIVYQTSSHTQLNLIINAGASSHAHGGTAA
jgi:hypothetical protein